MPELNIARMSEKISDIKQALKVLREYAGRDDNDFLTNDEAIRSARYCFIVLIEASTNIASHICARLLSRSPASYADSYLLLGNEGVISSDLAERLAKMAGFRNLLVHGYGEVDNRRMLSIMRGELSDVEAFLNEIGGLLRNVTGGDRNDG